MRQQVKVVYCIDGSTYAGVPAHLLNQMMKVKVVISETLVNLLREMRTKRSSLIVGISAEQMSN